jgi:hypothetical protein
LALEYAERLARDAPADAEISHVVKQLKQQIK